MPQMPQPWALPEEYEPGKQYGCAWFRFVECQHCKSGVLFRYKADKTLMDAYAAIAEPDGPN